MNKKLNKKGFTIVELVIVIAVIAILAAVLIPTFSGVIDRAKASNALSTAKNAYTSTLYSKNGDITVENQVDAYIVVDGEYYFVVDEGKIEAEEDTADIEAIKAKLSETANTNAEDWELASGIDDLAEGVKVYLYTAAVVANNP